MKQILSILCVLGAFVAVHGDGDVCYGNIREVCSSDDADLKLCNALYGRYGFTHDKIVNFAEEHVDISYKYLALSAYFDNYVQNRAGFSKYYREMSDKAWEDAIELIKYNNKRGQHIKKLKLSNKSLSKIETTELSEIDALAKTLDTQKSVAEYAQSIVTHGLDNTKTALNHVDPEVVSFMEEHFLHKHADKIRELAGHVQDLKRLISDGSTKSLAISLFDDYLLTV